MVATAIGLSASEGHISKGRRQQLSLHDFRGQQGFREWRHGAISRDCAPGFLPPGSRRTDESHLDRLSDKGPL